MESYTNIKREICEKIFQTNAYKNQHIKSTHGIKEKKFTCNVCDQKFESNHRLASHLKHHHHQDGQKNFKCDSCGKYVTTSRSLKNHIKTIHEQAF